MLLAGAAARGSDEPGRFAGEWKTTLGPVTIAQEGDDSSGSLAFFKLPLKGKVHGKELTFGYDEGQVHVDAKWNLEP